MIRFIGDLNNSFNLNTSVALILLFITCFDVDNDFLKSGWSMLASESGKTEDNAFLSKGSETSC